MSNSFANLYLYISKSKSVAFIFVTLLLSHISSHIIHFFFFPLFLNFYSSYSPKKKKLLFSLLVTVTLSPTFTLLLCLFISLLFSTLPLLFFHYSLFFIFWLFFSLIILFCINLVPFLPCNPYFSHKITVSTLSLSWWIFVLSYNFFFYGSFL